jgi:hypothetical protein
MQTAPMPELPALLMFVVGIGAIGWWTRASGRERTRSVR